MKKRALIISTLLAVNLYANSDFQSEIEWLKEETFVISASRVEENIKKAAASISVIDENEIKHMGARNILDILKSVTGLGVSQSNIWVSEIESRGVKSWFSEKVLLMLDGHSINSSLTNGGGTLALDKMNIDNIERIEIIRGPASALYGADAFTALINIITKKAKDIDGVITTLKGGSYDTKEVNLLFGKEFSENFAITGNLNYHTTDGFENFINSDASGNSGYNSPYRKQLKTDLAIDYKDFHLQGLYSDREDGPHFGVLNNINDEDKAKNKYYFVDLSYNREIFDNFNLKLRTYYDRYEFDNYWELFSEGYPTKDYTQGMNLINGATNSKSGAEILTTYHLSENNTLLFGGVKEKQKQNRVINIQNYDPESSAPLGYMLNTSNYSNWAPNVNRDFWAIYIENLYDITNDIRLTLGVRHDNYDDFGSVTNPRGGLTWQISDKYNLKLMYGEGFRAPTFSDIYNTSKLVDGNLNLNPEKAKTYELSFEAELSEILTTNITLFHNKYSDLIIKNAENKSINQGDSSTNGVELELKYSLLRGSYFMCNYTYQRGEDDLTNEDLADVPKHKANFIVDYKLNKYINIFTNLYFKGKTKRLNSDNRVDGVSSFATLNSSILVTNLYKNVELKASIFNILGKVYKDPAPIGGLNEDYLNEDRNAMFEISYKF